MKIKTGLAAFGLSGQIFHAPFIEAHPDFELTAVAERSKKSAQATYPDVESVDSFEELLRCDVELIVVNTPDATHYPLCRAALEAGKHVIVEKPFVTTIREAKELIEIADRKDLMLTTYQNRRWDGDFLTPPADRPARLAGQARRDTVLFPTIPPPTRTIRMERDTGRHPRRNHI